MKDSLLVSPYQNYLYLVGILKDAYKLDVQVDHRDIHTFIQNKLHVFKLMFGEDQETGVPSIVVSFHIDVTSHDAIEWFLRIKSHFSPIKYVSYYVEDDRGETYLGRDALKIKDIITTQEVLAKWLETRSDEEIQEFIREDVVGRPSENIKSYHSRSESELARIDFDRLKKPRSEKDYQ